MERRAHLRFWFTICYYLVTSLACHGYTAESNVTSDRIHGGQRANPRQFPYQVAILLRNNQICGGSLVVQPGTSARFQFVVTAAHCLYDPITKLLIPKQNFWIMAGSIDKQNRNHVVQVTDYVIHRDYNPRLVTSTADIAILKFRCCFGLSRSVQPIRLDSRRSMYRGRLTISGWGKTQSGRDPRGLRYVRVPEISLQNCRAVFGSAITQRNICAFQSGRGACRGDSGGPAVRYMVSDNVRIPVLRGIVSWGGWNEQAQNCLTETSPTVLTSVPRFRNWIIQNSGF